MNANPKTQQGNGKLKSSGITPRIIFWMLIFVMVLPTLVLFVSAGRWDWTAGWVYIFTMIVATLLSRIFLLLKTPELVAERVSSLSAEDAPSWDKLLVLLIVFVGPLSVLLVAGLDKRNAWSPEISSTVQIISLGVIVLGYLFATWAMLANRFFSGTVRIQEERGHTVETGGPYRFMRHPSYSGGIVATLATPLMLGSFWALIPAVLTSIIFSVRTALEDRTLQEELDGYKEYAGKVRYRLFPGVW